MNMDEQNKHIPATGVKKFFLFIGFVFFLFLSLFFISAAINGFRQEMIFSAVLLLLFSSGPALATVAFWNELRGARSKKVFIFLVLYIAALIIFFCALYFLVNT